MSLILVKENVAGPASATRGIVLLVLGLLALASRGFAQAAPDKASIGALKKLSLEELMDIQVTSVSKRPEKWLEAAAAIQILTQENIHRSGATSLPEALRLATNLQAAQVTSSNWTIGARGFNAPGTTSNKLLVMVDGRSVYSPLFAGTFWDTQDVFLPDVDRIEVISGPGGATWGANAVNGVINVLTKSARATQGTLVYAGAGEEEKAMAGVRHGGQIGSGYYRVYAKHLDFDGTVRTNGTEAGDRYTLSQGGFRADFGEDTGHWFTVQGDLYYGFIAQPAVARARLSGGNLLARWTRKLPADAQLQIQAYYDYAWRWAPNTFADRLETFDLDANHQFHLGERHLLLWGINARFWVDHVRNTRTQAFIPSDDTIRLGGIFVQDEIELLPDRLRLTLGTKFEYNDYSGPDHQPSLRLAWLASPAHTFWGSVARAVRTPSRLDRDFFQPPAPPFVVAGGPDFSSEVLWAYELGWRGQLFESLAASLTVFQHDYDDLRSLEPPVPLHFGNGVAGQSRGLEATLEYHVNNRWHWRAGYTQLQQRLHLKPGSADLNRASAEISDPKHQFQVRTSLDLPLHLQLDLGLRRIGAVPMLAGGVRVEVPAYTELDARLAWLVRAGLEVAVVGQSLLHSRHPETGAPNNRREIERSVHGKATWRF